MKPLSPAASEALQKCRDLLRRKHYALTTEQVYCGHIGSYINWLGLHGRALPNSRARVEDAPPQATNILPFIRAA